MGERRPSIPRIVRQIRRHKRAICLHRNALLKLREELSLIDCYVEDAERSLQEALNDLERVG